MTVQIKLLKGFKNPINHEKNTLSLLVKSDCKLQEHISSSREKLLTSLTCIIKHYKNKNCIAHFYHKLQISNNGKTTYPKTKLYKTTLDSINLDTSIENLLRVANGNKFDSHFET